MYLSEGWEALRNCLAASEIISIDILLTEHSKLTLREDVHWIVDLNVHVVANCGKLVLLGANDAPILGLDLP